MSTISGNVGASVAALVIYGGQSVGSVVAVAGAYSIPGLANGTYSLFPVFNGLNFTPFPLDVVIAGADVPGQNFTAQAVSSPTDSRVSPNSAVNIQASLQYTVEPIDSRVGGGPVDSRAGGPPEDSRTAPNIPINSRM
jgi:hypothetical protein